MTRSQAASATEGPWVEGGNGHLFSFLTSTSCLQFCLWVHSHTTCAYLYYIFVDVVYLCVLAGMGVP